MRFTVGEAAKMSGVSVRTLHYYDEVGLLAPSEVGENGYRYYNEEDLARLQQILFYRELDFPLHDIARILSLPDYDRQEAMRRQRELLVLKQQRIGRLVRLLDRQMKGESPMDFTPFGMEDIEKARAQYANEARERWGGGDAYQESEKRTKGYSKEDWSVIQKEMDGIFRDFAALRGRDPADVEAQECVRRWQEHITKRYYPCGRDILAGLGEMYVGDDRFTQNIDRFGEGTAAFMSRAIAVYCGQ